MLQNAGNVSIFWMVLGTSFTAIRASIRMRKHRIPVFRKTPNRDICGYIGKYYAERPAQYSELFLDTPEQSRKFVIEKDSFCTDSSYPVSFKSVLKHPHKSLTNFILFYFLAWTTAKIPMTWKYVAKNSFSQTMGLSYKFWPCAYLQQTFLGILGQFAINLIFSSRKHTFAPIFW